MTRLLAKMLRPQSLSARWNTSLDLLPTNLIESIGISKRYGTCGQGTLASASDVYLCESVDCAGVEGVSACGGGVVAASFTGGVDDFGAGGETTGCAGV